MGKLDTDRLVLRWPEPSLAAALTDYHRRNAEHFAPYGPRRPEGFHSLEAWQERALRLWQASAAGHALHVLIFLRGGSSTEIVGDVNFTNVVRGAFQATYLGYQLDQAHVGRGLMREALSVCIDHVFGHMHLHRIMANYMPTNQRGARLLRKLGFVPEGYARDYLMIDGTWADHVLTSLTNRGFREDAEPSPVRAG